MATVRLPSPRVKGGGGEGDPPVILSQNAGRLNAWVANSEYDEPMPKPRDWLLLTLATQSEPIRIQKTLFKLSREAKRLPAPEAYKFVPYNWGPFSNAIYGDVKSLMEQGLVRVIPQPGHAWRRYALTEKGTKRVETLQRKLCLDTQEKLNDISDWIDARPDFDDLLADTYEDYPEMAQKSLFRAARTFREER